MKQSYTLKELEIALRLMQPRQQLYELVKNEVKRRGHWRGKPRGRLFNKDYNPYRERQRQAALARRNRMTAEEWSAMSRRGALATARKRRGA
jgi:hypothetical protein